MKANDKRQSFFFWWLLLFGVYMWYLQGALQRAREQAPATQSTLPAPGAAPAEGLPTNKVAADPKILPPPVLEELVLGDPRWAKLEPAAQAAAVFEALKGEKDPEAKARLTLTAAYLYDAAGQEREAAKIYADVNEAVDRRAMNPKEPATEQVTRALRRAAQARLRAAELYLEVAESEQDARAEKQARKTLNHVVMTLQRDAAGKTELYERQADGTWRKSDDPYGLVLERIDHIARDTWAYKLIDGLVRLCGNAGGISQVLALILLAICLKAAMFPLSRKQYASMQAMQKLQPELQALQKRFKDNPQRLNEEMMKLYREHQVNPMAGCLPMFIQLPVFIGVYQGIQAYTFHYHHTRLLWVESLAGPDTILLLVYGLSMFGTSLLMVKMQPPPSDPSAAMTQKIMTYGMPLIFTWMMHQWRLPSAFYLYWMTFNVLSTIEQVITQKARQKKDAAAAAAPPTGPPPEAERPSAGRRRAGRKSGSTGRRKRRGG